MRPILLVPLLVMVCTLLISTYPACAQKSDLRGQLLADEGRTFSGMKDPEFASYDLILREYVARRIKRHYGVTVDPRRFASGFAILEFESLLRCMKPGEPVERYLQETQKRP
jgi:hypothetical protein